MRPSAMYSGPKWRLLWYRPELCTLQDAVTDCFYSFLPLFDVLVCASQFVEGAFTFTNTHKSGNN